MERSTIVRAKCIVIGDSCVGKTALVQAFLEPGQFPKNYNMTQGVDVQTKKIKVPDSSTTVELFLYDCAGKSYYRDLVLRLCHQTSLVIVVYDVSEETSFANVVKIFEEVKQASGSSVVKGVLYGNKSDLFNRRVISPKAGHDLAQSLGLVYFEGSAKENKDVDEPFYFMVNEWFKTYTDKTHSMRTVG
ncbi:intraflagellar transport protein 27 homolog [Hyalella azteca]|uniref:Intraflagellar transport protein 27 homolog n=1 Tax=Hyalella azteca TaxID=294128 RepID=A0A8B7PGH0_HYAAZ|nr:intraflagellar transport protein 27 homolog [Hyalella azteca]